MRQFLFVATVFVIQSLACELAIADYTGTTSDPNVTFLSAGPDAMEGTFEISITTPGERAVVVSAPVIFPLSSSETLTINGVEFSVSAGSTQEDLISRINEFTFDTNVFAIPSVAFLDSTLLASTEFGSDGIVSVSSTGTAAGFTIFEQFDTGIDIEGAIGGILGFGEGQVLEAADIELSVSASESVYVTHSGALGTVTITRIPEPFSGVAFVSCSLIFLKRRRVV